MRNYSFELNKSTKNLTNRDDKKNKFKGSKDLTNVLYQIGIAKVPLSRSEIEDKCKEDKKSLKYVHEILKNLVPNNINTDINYIISSDDVLSIYDLEQDKLFVWDEIIGSTDSKKKLKIFKKIFRLCELNWEIDEEKIESGSFKVESSEIELNKFLKFFFTDVQDPRQITITMNSRYPKQQSYFDIKDVEYIDEKETRIDKQHLEKKSLQVIVKLNQQKKYTVYAIKPSVIGLNYFDVSYEDKIQKRITLLENSNMNYEIGIQEPMMERRPLDNSERMKRIQRIKSDRSKWRYSLNIRGFLLYLFRENEENKNKKHVYTMIKKVILNPLNINKFIFLKAVEKFDKAGFPVAEILISIAHEFHNQLNYEESCILGRVTERYFTALDSYFQLKYRYDYSLYVLPGNTILKEFYFENLEYLKNYYEYLLQYKILKRLEDIKMNIKRLEDWKIESSK